MNLPHFFIDSQIANLYHRDMKIIANRSITEYWMKYPDAKASLAVWEERIFAANCKSHDDLKKIFANANYIPNPNFKHLTLFNIKGNEYRLAVDIFFNTGLVFIKWFGKHSKYDKTNFYTIPNGGFNLC